jgi:hypothetical protein
MRAPMDLHFYQDSLQRHGPKATLLHAGYRLASHGHHFAIWHAFALTPGGRPRGTRHDSAEGRFVDADAMRAYTADPDNGLDGHLLETAARRGDRCYLITQGGVLASYGWYSTRSPMPLPEVDARTELHFDPAYAYLYACFTRPEFRGRHLQEMGVRAGLEELGSRGLVAYVGFNNQPSLRAFRRTGWWCFGHALLGRFGNRWKTWCSPGCARFDFRLERA